MQPDDSTQARDSRLIALRVMMKGMLLIALLSALWVMFRSMGDGPDDAGSDAAATEYYVGDLAPGQWRIVDWDGKPLLILHRQAAWLELLQGAHTDLLLDVDSRRSSQPESARNALRSPVGSWFVAVALGTDLGCTVTFSAPSAERYKREPWPGGFIDSCRKSRYDMAGRVYRGELAGANLVVPEWRFNQTAATVVVGRSE